MTTNSPNQVDGDVQAHIMPALTQAERKTAIDSCVDEIAHLERCIKAYPDQPVLKVDLLVQQVALAALTAEPVAHRYAYLPGIGDADWKYVDSSEYANKSSGYSGQDLYTTPPAQLLRPVELPDCDFGAVSHMSGGSKDYCNGFVDGTNNAIKAIREAGYEVKNG